MKRETQQLESESGPLTHWLFKMMPSDDADYPSDGGATVYWARRLLNPSYELAVGAQELEYELSTVGNYLYVNSGAEVLEGSIVLADQVAGRWYIRGVIQDPIEDD